MPLAQTGFGQEVREAILARAEHLADQGLVQRDGQRLVLQRNLLSTLRRRELETVGKHLSAETGLPQLKAEAGASIAGTLRQRLSLSSGRFAVIDNGLGFQLVPWSRELDRKLGQHVAGVAKEGGGIEWSLGRKRDLGLGL